MPTILVPVAMPTAPYGAGIDHALERFYEIAGERLRDAVREVLGHDEVYRLAESYAAIKPLHPKYKRFAGKDPDQPLILSGEMWEGIEFEVQKDGVVVRVAEGKGIGERGEDYAEKWEEVTRFLEMGLERIEDDLADWLLDVLEWEGLA